MKQLILKGLRAYQAISRSVGANPLFLGSFSGCRSWPTCSEYAIDILERDGVIRGGAKAVARIVRCNPLWPVHYHG